MWESIHQSWPIFSVSFLPLILIGCVASTRNVIFMGILMWWCYWVIQSGEFGNFLLCMVVALVVSIVISPICNLFSLLG